MKFHEGSHLYVALHGMDTTKLKLLGITIHGCINYMTHPITYYGILILMHV